MFILGGIFLVAVVFEIYWSAAGWPGVISGLMMVMGKNDMADMESNVENIFKVEESGNHSHEESGKNMEKYLQHWRNRRIF